MDLKASLRVEAKDLPRIESRVVKRALIHMRQQIIDMGQLNWTRQRSDHLRHSCNEAVPGCIPTVDPRSSPERQEILTFSAAL